VAGSQDGASGREYEAAISRELEGVLSQIKGAGRVRVSVSLERGPVYVYGTNTSTDSRTTDEKDASGGTRTVVETTSTRQAVVLRDERYGERPLVTEEQRPTVAGILVLAEGAGASRVRLDIMRAVQALFPIAAHKITVLPMGR
jgi:stage III sporulation protein AG